MIDTAKLRGSLEMARYYKVFKNFERTEERAKTVDEITGSFVHSEILRVASERGLNPDDYQVYRALLNELGVEAEKVKNRWCLENNFYVEEV